MKAYRPKKQRYTKRRENKITLNKGNRKKRQITKKDMYTVSRRADSQRVRLLGVQEVAVAGLRVALGLGHAGAGQEATLGSVGDGDGGTGTLGLSHGLS